MVDFGGHLYTDEYRRYPQTNKQPDKKIGAFSRPKVKSTGQVTDPDQHRKTAGNIHYCDNHPESSLFKALFLDKNGWFIWF
jgi:hypothetical protein